MGNSSSNSPNDQPADRTPNSRRRPFGLKAIIFLLILRVVLSFVLGLLIVVIAPQLDRIAIDSPVDLTIRDFIIQGINLAVTPVIIYGLWRFRGWAWNGIMIVLALSMAIDLIYFVAIRPNYISMLLNVLMVFYLNQQEVKALFEPSAQPALHHFTAGESS